MSDTSIGDTQVDPCRVHGVTMPRAESIACDGHACGSSPMRGNDFFSGPGNENGYINVSISLVRQICVAMFVARSEKKIECA